MYKFRLRVLFILMIIGQKKDKDMVRFWAYSGYDMK